MKPINVWIAAYLIVCVLSAGLFIFREASTTIAGVNEITESNYRLQTFLSDKISEEEMSSVEKAFYSDFPGQATRYKFENGTGQLILRYVTAPTRKLHPAQECYLANGLTVDSLTPESIIVPELSSLKSEWSRFETEQEGTRYEVWQAVFSLSGDWVYPDISEWYWKTVFSSDDAGPWLAVTWSIAVSAD